MFDMLHAPKCVTCCIMQNARFMIHRENVWHSIWHKMLTCYLTQNVWHANDTTFVTYYMMLHATKCLMCYIMLNMWQLYDIKCVTSYMTKNVWCATWHRKCDMLHKGKYVTY